MMNTILQLMFGYNQIDSAIQISDIIKSYKSIMRYIYTLS